MKLFADSKSLEEVEKDIGEPVGQLLTPLTYRSNFRPNQPFGIDNGCFKKFYKDRWLKILERERPNAKNCKFVAMPDVVGNARRTLELFEHYRHLIIDRFGLEYPIALVIQNGQENLPIEWGKLDAIFIGGDTRFKMSQEVVQIIQCAKRLDKYVHVGRVNEPSRWQHFENLDCDSFDGTGISQFTKQRLKIAQQRNHPKLIPSGIEGTEPYYKWEKEIEERQYFEET